MRSSNCERIVDLEVGVGIMIAHNPLHGSGQAGFPHPALALSDDAHASQGIGMTDGKRRQPVGVLDGAFRFSLQRRRPGGRFFTWLHTRPARFPVNASTRPLRAAPHDSGPMWVASSHSYDFCIHYTSPV
jgi:hypothetical protein